MAKAKKKKEIEQPLKIKGSFQDVIAASVKNVDVKKKVARSTKKSSK